MANIGVVEYEAKVIMKSIGVFREAPGLRRAR